MKINFNNPLIVTAQRKSLAMWKGLNCIKGLQITTYSNEFVCRKTKLQCIYW